MAAEQKLSLKAQRKLRRRLDADAAAKVARFWKAPRTVERRGHTGPVNKQAAMELSHRAAKKP